MSLDFDNIVVKVDNRIIDLKTSEVPLMVMPQSWDGISGKPSAYPPSEHSHDDRYYTETEVDEKIDSEANDLLDITLPSRSVVEKTENLLYFSDKNNFGRNPLTASYPDSSTIVLNGTQYSGIPFLIGLNGKPWVYNEWNPNMQAGTYYYKITVSGTRTPASGATVGSLRFRRRYESEFLDGDTEGTNISISGSTCTLEEDAELLIRMTSPSGGSVTYDNYTIRLEFYAESQRDYIPGFTAVDYKMRKYGDLFSEITEETGNLFEITSVKNVQSTLSYSFVDSNTIVLDGYQPSGKSLTINFRNINWSYYYWQPNFEPGTYYFRMTVIGGTKSKDSGAGGGNIYIRARNKASADLAANGANQTSNGVVTFTEDMEVYVWMTAGTGGGIIFDNYTIRLECYEGDIPQPYIPSTTTIDRVARNQSIYLSKYFRDSDIENVGSIVNANRNWDDLVFAAGTDYHYCDTQSQNNGIFTLQKILNNINVCFLAELGDNIRGYETNGVDDPQSVRKLYQRLESMLNSLPCPIRWTNGNHDDASDYVGLNSKDAEDFISDVERHNYYVKQSGKDIVKNHGLYYYFDLDEYKIRVIVLDSSDIPRINDEQTGEAKYFAVKQHGFSNAQINWLKDALYVDDDWAFIIMSHAPLTRASDGSDGDDVIESGALVKNRLIVLGLINACSDGIPYSAESTETDFECSVSADFTGWARKILVCLSGHQHADQHQYTDGILHCNLSNGSANTKIFIVNRDEVKVIPIKSGEMTVYEI